MTDLRGGGWATPSEELTALLLEARRQGLSYGQLVANTNRWDLREVIWACCAEKKTEVEEERIMRMYKTGDLCPCCGQPIQHTDPGQLRRFSMLVDVMGLGAKGEGRGGQQ